MLKPNPGACLIGYARTPIGSIVDGVFALMGMWCRNNQTNLPEM